MKNVFKFMAVAVVASLTLVACNNNNKAAEEVADTNDIEAIAEAEEMLNEGVEAVDTAATVAEEVAEAAAQTVKKAVKKAAEQKAEQKAEKTTKSDAPVAAPEAPADPNNVKTGTSITIKRR